MDFSKVNLSFSGCGFLCIYHAGVCAALKEYAPQMTRNHMYGASAGAIIAAGLLCDVNASEATSTILQVVCQANASCLQAIDPRYDLMGLAKEGMEKLLPENAHEICSGRLFVSLTRYEDRKNVMVSQFDSKADLIDAILCSCYIPFFCRWEYPYYKGVCYIDGGFSDNQPVMDPNTVTISPFSGESDICPMDHHSGSILGCTYFNSSIRFTTENLYRFCSCFIPPSQEICSQICRQGFADALRFLTKNAITPCTRCLIVQSNRLEPRFATNRGSTEETSGRGGLYLHMPSLNAVNNVRRRLESECELCLERLETHLNPLNTNELFPEVIQKTLNEAKAKEYRLLTYVASFRLVQWGWSWVSPWLTPVEYSIVMAKMFKAWLRSAKRRDFVLEKLEQVADLILKGIEERNLLCSHTCGRPHLHRSKSVTAPTAQLGAAASMQPATPKGEMLTAASRRENLQVSDSTCYGGYDQDVDSMARLVEYSERHDAVLAYHYRDASDQLHVCKIFDLNTPRKSSRETHIPLANSKLAKFAGSSKRLSQSTTLYEVEASAEKEERLPLQRSSKLPTLTTKATKTKQKRDSSLPMVEKKGKGGEDSGVSLAEDRILAREPGGEGVTKKRDACCSPVLHLAESEKRLTSTAIAGGTASSPTTANKPSSSHGSRLRAHTSRFTNVIRRHTIGVPHHHHSQQQMHGGGGGKASTLSAPVGSAYGGNGSRKTLAGHPFSSDSDADAGDELFVVAMTRKRVNSGEYDGEPEPSDTDPGR